MALMTNTGGTDRLGFLLHDAARLIRRRFERRNAAYGLSAAQWRLLFRLIKEEGAPQVRLAEWLEIEPISVSRLLDRMEEGGWIERRQDASDRRVRVIYATDKAREVYDAVKSVAFEVYEEALAGMDDGERAALIAGLQRISANLADGEESPHCAANQATDRNR
ncbi:MarR family winged helix-turn-helix transcriptional regulator [Mesorhizobium xinjiangense]|uniref:MarR family winged helix-turn-helix transcriptional regulator n=1 Tax=Mesorhizobium xinjiangense TaxID=2678685 RepID=UPI0012ED0961|nr:MarR family transcriptional regulator [Mesorhizobium xinjiangense]